MTVFYVGHIGQIGGVETYLFEIAKKYKDKDICIYYEKADLEQLNRLRKYVRCRQFNGEKINCDTLITNYNTNFANNVNANHYYAVIHADHVTQSSFPITLNDKIERYFGVSENACASFTKLTGISCELFVNPLTVDKPNRVLHLLSATRLGPEKGKDRMIKLGEMLNEAGIPYIWTIFTTDLGEIDNPNIVYMLPRLDIRDYIADSDYLVQLSSSEARSYSVSEALALGTPVIASEHPSFKYQGVENGKTGYILPYDMSDVPITEIYRNIPKFKPIQVNDRYGEIIEGKSTYTKEEMELAFDNTDGVVAPETQKGKRFMTKLFINQYGNCIKEAKSNDDIYRLERLGYKEFIKPKSEQVKAADSPSESNTNTTPKAATKKATTKKAVKKNG